MGGTGISSGFEEVVDWNRKVVVVPMRVTGAVCRSLGRKFDLDVHSDLDVGET